MSAEILYIISSSFDYNKLILRDHGPGYAEDMNWKSDSFKNIVNYKDRVFVVDNRITPEECTEIKEIVKMNPSTLFVFTIIDPYYEWENANPYIKTLFEIKDFENVFFLSKYDPRELTKDLDDASRNIKMLILPYPFRNETLRRINFYKRINKLFISGNMHPDVYPLRSAVRMQAKWNPFLWSKVALLQHPGYPDIGQKSKHDIIGGAYIDYLSQFTLMLCCPSRCDLEFLKYSECAYAGCVPVGRAPATFNKGLKECVLEINPKDIYGSIKGFLKIPLNELQQRAESFRNLMERERNPALLNQKLHNFLHKQ